MNDWRLKTDPDQRKNKRPDSCEESSVKQVPLISLLHSVTAHQFPVLPSAAGYLRAG